MTLPLHDYYYFSRMLLLPTYLMQILSYIISGFHGMEINHIFVAKELKLIFSNITKHCY